MAIVLDKEGIERLKKTVGARAKAARTAAAMKLTDAKSAIGQKGITQLSLMESGDRLPPLLMLIQLADLYCVPLDYLVGRNDDPIADPIENNQGMIMNAVMQAISGCVGTMGKSIGEYTSIAVAGQRRDRADLMQINELMSDLEAAFNRMKLLNPEFEEDWRGSANLEAAMKKITVVAERVNGRMQYEQKLRDGVEKTISKTQMNEKTMQFLLDLVVQ